MIKIGVVIPYRPTPTRVALFEKVLEWYNHYLPNANIYICDAPGEYWQPSASRNLGVAQATKENCDVIIMNDADTIPDGSPLYEAVQACQKTGMIHNPYTICVNVGGRGTRQYINEGRNIKECMAKSWSSLACFGVIVFTPKAWYDIGGMDEKFIQWGPEDRAMEHAHLIIKGTGFVHHEGHIWCLTHEEQTKDIGYNENVLKNKELYRKYLSTDNPETILKLVSAKPEELDNFISLNVKSVHLDQ